MSNTPHPLSKPRPVNLNLLTMHFPVTAIVSILHRISGVILFFFVPFLLWVFHRSLASPDDFSAVQHQLQSPFIKLIAWAVLTGLVYHIFAGIRHLIADIGIGEDLKPARFSAWLVLALSSVTAIVLGIWLW